MERIESFNTNLSLKNKDNTINNEFIFLYARPGFGKTLAIESLAEIFFKAGYVVISLSDVKDGWEFAYSMFPPKKKYHLDRLAKDRISPGKKQVKLYHPFTFNIPNKKLPEINFYGFSLKDLTRTEYSMITETPWEGDTTRVLINASHNLPNNQGLQMFLHQIQDSIYGKKEARELKPDPKIFNLKITSGTAKTLQDVASYFLPFEYEYFLLPDNSDLKLNWENILNDNSNYHVFSTKYLSDDKLKHLCVLTLLNQLITARKKGVGNKPVLIIMNEMRYLVPANPRGYKFFLAESLKSLISIMRNIGEKGNSLIGDSQNWSDVDENVKGSGTHVFFGELAEKDAENVSKALRLSKEQLQHLINMDIARKSQPSFFSKEDYEIWTPRFPSHCHAEEEYVFENMYKDYYPKNMKNYTELVRKVKEFKDSEAKKIEEKIKRERQKKREEEERKKREKEEKQKQKEMSKEKPKEPETKNVEVIRKMCYDMYNDESIPKKDRSYRRIGEKLGLSKDQVNNHIKKYEQKLKEEKPEIPGVEELKSDYHEKRKEIYESNDMEVPEE